jgi:hypothetical protein
MGTQKQPPPPSLGPVYMEASYPRAEAKLLAQAGQTTETSALFIWNRIACSPDLPHDCRA